ncbi:MAG: Uma2 family endonuclease [Bryobacteraceae bacterium]
MATTTGLTVKDFLALPLPEGKRYELVGGEIVEMAGAGKRHERVKAKINRVLVEYLLRNEVGEVYVETLYQISEVEGRIPDVSLQLNEQMPPTVGDGPFEIAPALAVEVVSSESAADLENKVELYLEKGSRTVWVVYPELRTVRIFDQSGAARLIRGDEPVQVEWLPGFSVPASKFFEGL